MRNLKELHFMDFSPKKADYTPTPERVERLEALAGVKLPQEYIEFLHYVDGREILENTFHYKDMTGFHEDSIAEFNHFGPQSDLSNIELDEVIDTLWNPQAWDGDFKDLLFQYLLTVRTKPELAKLISIASGPTGDLYCLDFRDGGNGRVIMLMHDPPDEVIIAESFGAWVDEFRDPQLSG